jgi:2-hydroxy-3-oxopropionate reductase
MTQTAAVLPTLTPIPAADGSTPIGFVGLGLMGAGMARCLRRKGFALTVYNRDPAKAEPLRAAGASVGTLAEVGQTSRVVVVCVSDTAAAEAVLFGPEGLASTLQPGACVIDASTLSADGARRFAAQLAQQGIAYLDAPVSGGQQGAEEGTLVCMVGGDAQAFAACQAVFAAFAARAVHMGPAGNGQVTKACNQVAVTAAMLGVAESMALAQRQGVDPARVREVLLGGTAKSLALERFAPRMISGDHKPGFRAVLMRKDLRLALDSGREGGSYMPVAALAAQLLDVVVNRGEGDLDWSVLGKLFAEWSGAPHTGGKSAG